MLGKQPFLTKTPISSATNISKLEIDKELMPSVFFHNRFNCFLVISIRQSNASVLGEVTTIFDNFSEVYGPHGDNIRTDLVSLLENNNSCLIRPTSKPAPILCIYSERSNRNAFGVPGKYGFDTFTHIIGYPFWVNGSNYIFWLFSENCVGRDNIHNAIETIKNWARRSRKHSKPIAVFGRSRTVGNSEENLLSENELECLRWVAAGKTLQDVSALTGKSYKYVRYHIEKARDKYGFSTVNQTLVQATIDYNLNPNHSE